MSCGVQDLNQISVIFYFRDHRYISRGSYHYASKGLPISYSPLKTTPVSVLPRIHRCLDLPFIIISV